MEYSKVINYKYTLDEQDKESLRRVSSIVKNICNLSEENCLNCPFISNCAGPHQFEAFFETIIEKDGKNIQYEY